MLHASSLQQLRKTAGQPHRQAYRLLLAKAFGFFAAAFSGPLPVDGALAAPLTGAPSVCLPAGACTQEACNRSCSSSCSSSGRLGLGLCAAPQQGRRGQPAT